MARPKAKELTERELELMHIFWSRAEATAAEIREELARSGRDLAYTTVATLIRILCEKDFLEQLPGERPYQYRALRSFDEVSRSLVGDLIQRVFGGSREQLLMRLVDERKLTRQERAALERILREEKS